MIRAFGNEYRIPGSPAVNSNEPIEQACPTHHVAIAGFTYCIVSYMASPAVTTPPGEFIYKCIGLFAFSDCKYKSWATTKELISSLICPIKHIILSLSRRENFLHLIRIEGFFAETVGDNHKFVISRLFITALPFVLLSAMGNSNTGIAYLQIFFRTIKKYNVKEAEFLIDSLSEYLREKALLSHVHIVLLLQSKRPRAWQM
ncbi:hypothetical protein GQX74_002481 [Glossina fuscipes]|nr:hypothetical protein GQX74_002481 [Glossina fuscipes]